MTKPRAYKWTRLAIVAAVVVAIAVVSIIIGVLGSFRKCHKLTSGSASLASVRLLYFNLSSVPPIVIVGRAADYVNVAELKLLGVKDVIYLRTLKSLGKTVPEAYADKVVIVLHIDDVLKYRPATILGKLIQITKHVKSFQVIVLNPEKSREKGNLALQLLLKLLGYYGARPIVPCYGKPESKLQACKIHPAVYTAAALAASYNPLGFVIVEDLDKPTLDVLDVVKMYVEKPRLLGTVQKRVLFNITRLEGFDFIGYIGWLNAKAYGKVCHEVTGEMWIKVEYYVATKEVSGKKYEWFLAYVIHSAKGYITTCNGATYKHTPEKFTDEFYWMTDVWPGQVLWDWGPKNEGGPQTTITYTVTAGLQGETPVAQASVSYAVTTSGSAYEWYNDGDPGAGVIIIVHKLLNGKPDRLYTVEPSSVGLLDPTKEGGCEPMIVYHYFKTKFTYGDTAEINFYIYLYDNSTGKV